MYVYKLHRLASTAEQVRVKASRVGCVSELSLLVGISDGCSARADVSASGRSSPDAVAMAATARLIAMSNARPLNHLRDRCRQYAGVCVYIPGHRQRRRVLSSALYCFSDVLLVCTTGARDRNHRHKTGSKLLTRDLAPQKAWHCYR